MSVSNLGRLEVLVNNLSDKISMILDNVSHNNTGSEVKKSARIHRLNMAASYKIYTVLQIIVETSMSKLTRQEVNG
jgi:hypothetical protein